MVKHGFRWRKVYDCCIFEGKAIEPSNLFIILKGENVASHVVDVRWMGRATLEKTLAEENTQILFNFRILAGAFAFALLF